MEESNSMISKQNFIVFGEDFARHPHALEHLMRPLFAQNKTLWVETIGLRSPKLNFYDLARIKEKLLIWFKTNQRAIKRTEPTKHVTIISPFMIPFNQFTLIRKFNQWSVTRSIKKKLIELKMTDPITISSVPNACDYVGRFKEKLVVYFCVDEFSLWPGLDKKMVSAFEKKLIAKSDLILATSDTLACCKTKNGLVTPVITHGVEFEHFNIGPKKNIKEEFYNVCYFGLFDERTNQNILEAIANSDDKFMIHIIGKVVCDIRNLKEISNIKFHGPCLYSALPEIMDKMDAFILPYEKNELTHFINPLKLKEYLSSGRPVIASDLPEVVKLKDYLFVAESSEKFVEILKNLKEESISFNSSSVTKYMENYETWKAKAQLFSKILKENLPETP